MYALIAILVGAAIGGGASIIGYWIAGIPGETVAIIISMPFSFAAGFFIGTLRSN